jgi:hypothetical protein
MMATVFGRQSSFQARRAARAKGAERRDLPGCQNVTKPRPLWASLADRVLQSSARAPSVRPGLGRLAVQSLPGNAKVKVGHYLLTPWLMHTLLFVMLSN